MKTGILTEPALVGRESELGELNSLLETAIDGKGKAVFISGEAGSGKTRLINEFLKRAHQKGATILTGWCLSDATVPYFPFVTAFDTYFSADSDDTLVAYPQAGLPAPQVNVGSIGIQGFGITTWLPGLKPNGKNAPETLSPQVWKDQLFAAVGKTLHAMATQSPIILFIDDLQWADSASISLLHFICRTIGSEKILVLATYRNEELTSDAEGKSHPLADLIRQIRREELFSEIELSNFKQSDVHKIIKNLVGGEINPALIEKLAKESGGNALFLIESLRMLSEHKLLIQENNQWRLATDDLGVPSKIKDIILRRLGLLKNAQRRVLDAASVVGEKFNVELLSTVLGQDILEVLETLTVIERSTSLVRAEGNQYRFDHAKSRETLYGEIPSALRSGYHMRIAERLQSLNKNGKLPLTDLAYHYAQAGNSEKATKYAMEAAQDELSKFSNAEASKHFRYVLDNTSETPENGDERLKALEGLGDSLYAMSALKEAAEVFDQLSKKAESDVIKLRALRKATLCLYWLGDIQNALESASRAKAYSSSDRLEYARLSLFRGFITGRTGENSEAIKDMEQALKIFQEEYSLPDVAQALVELTFIYRMKNRATDAFVSALRSVLMFEELEDLRGLALAYNRLSGPLNEFGLNQDSLEKLQKSIQLEEKIGDYNLLALDFWAAGQMLQKLGSPEKATAQYLKGIEYAKKTNGYYVQCICYSALIKQYARIGDIERAQDFAEKFSKLLEDTPSLKDNRMVINVSILTKGYLQAAKGELNEAIETFQSGLKHENMDSSAWHPSQLMGFKASLGRLLARQGRTEESEVYIKEAEEIRTKISEQLQQANTPKANLMAKKEIGVGEELNIRLDVVNTTKNAIVISKINKFVPDESKVISQPAYSTIQDGNLILNERTVKPYSAEPIKLKIRIAKAGIFNLAPHIVYSDSPNETKTLLPEQITITVHPTLRLKIAEETITIPIMPNRMTTGFADLDALLLGGIPEKYAVILSSPSNDERELLLRRFLEAGTQRGEITFYLTGESNKGKTLAKQFQSQFYIFSFDAQDTSVQTTNNYKLKGIENLTEIDIALIKAFRSLSPPAEKRRILIETTSDILLQHHAITTRRWLSSLLPTLKSNGFTVLAVINPQMHPLDEAQAILSLFEGEIRIAEKETPAGLEKTLRVSRLYNQKYLNQEISLTREQLTEGNYT